MWPWIKRWRDWAMHDLWPLYRIGPQPQALLYREHVLGQLALPFMSREDFLQSLRLQMPTVFVRLGNESVACQTFVSSQCKGFLASAVLTSPISLVPLLDLDLQVEFRCERS